MAFGVARPNANAGGSSAAAVVQPESRGMSAPAGAFDRFGGWPAILGRVAAGADLGPEEAGAALAEVLDGNATPAQIAAFVFGLRCKGETVEEMTGLVAAMLAAAERVVVPDAISPRLVDTC